MRRRQREVIHDVHRQRLKPVADMLGGLDAHGWIAAVLLREMESLEGQATVENVGSSLKLTRCIRQGSVAAPTLWLKLATHMVWNVEELE